MLDWFTTIPGILIICGVILLVIAIILFVVGNKKGKNEMTSVTMEAPANNSMPTVDTASVTPDVVAPVVDNTSVNIENSAASVNSNNDAPVLTPGMDELKIEDVVPQEQTFTINTESVDNVVPTAVDSTPVNTEEEVSFSIPAPVEINEPTTQENNTIYGGETPTTSFTVNEEKPVTIYGGNDPLEATQTLPKMEEHHEPYGGSYPEAKMVDVEPVNVEVTPVEDVVTPLPAEEVPMNTMEPATDVSPEMPTEPVSEVAPQEEPVVQPEVEISQPEEVANVEPVSVPTEGTQQVEEL